MRIQVLGCSGGVVAGAQTTSFLLNENTLIDAGTGVFNLSLSEQQKIERVFITHAHLDHAIGLPFLMENVVRYRQDNGLPPIQIYASQSALHDIHTHLFNDRVWPDFTKIPNPQMPTMQLQALEVGAHIALSETLSVEAISAVHNVPTQGYAVHHQNNTWIYTGDTTSNPLLWQYINQLPQQGKKLRWLVTETTFVNADQSLANQSQHYTVNGLVSDIHRHLLHGQFELHIMHLKPAARENILQELDPLHIALAAKNCSLHIMQNEQMFTSHTLPQKAVLHAA